MAKRTRKPAEPKRAHNDDGKFKADDPATPEVNEAYEAPALTPLQEAADVIIAAAAGGGTGMDLQLAAKNLKKWRAK